MHASIVTQRAVCPVLDREENPVSTMGHASSKPSRHHQLPSSVSMPVTG